MLDFGREVAGRLIVESASPADATLSIAYGESEIEALATGLTPGQQGGNYLGTNLLEVPANGVARGPKSGFRYVLVRFLRGAPITALNQFALKASITRKLCGSFESSDAVLNRIWEAGAYTAHLCMQDGVWDAVKRDRGRWGGDLDIEGRVISTVFGDRTLMEETLRSLVPSDSGHVNGIPSYSALWITTLESLYRSSGDKVFIASEHDDLLRILGTMEQASMKMASSIMQSINGSLSIGLLACTPIHPKHASVPNFNTSAAIVRLRRCYKMLAIQRTLGDTRLKPPGRWQQCILCATRTEPRTVRRGNSML